MRSFLSFVFGVCAVLATLVTAPATWVSHNIADEDGYVAFAEPIARDAGFRGELADALSESLVKDSTLPVSLQPVAKEAIVRIANELADKPGFVTAWNDTQRQSHKIMLGDQKDLPARLDSSSRFAIDLGPLEKFVVDQVNKDLPFTVPASDQTIVAFNGAPQDHTLERVRESPMYARDGLIIVAVFVALTLAFARRRSIAVAWLGLGAIAAAGLLKVAASVGLPQVLDRNTAPTPFAKAALDVFLTRANESFDHSLVVLAIGGAVAAAVGVLSRLVTSRSGV